MRKFIGEGIPAGGALPLLLVVLLFTSSCLVKKTVSVPVSAGILAAKTATLDELLASLARHSNGIRALSSTSLKVSFTSGKVESGKLQAYRSAPGYILLRRPDSIRLNIQNPVTKTSLAELVSAGDAFSLWYPRENKFFIGKNSMKEFDLEGHPGFTARPIHIVEAILPRKIDLAEAGVFLSLVEESDASAKYYVITLLKGASGPILHLNRKLWIDRSELTVSRQEVFDDEGKVISDVHYSQLTRTGDLMLPLLIKIERPQEGYSLDMQFKDWRVNPELPQTAFEASPPAGAHRIELIEKGRSE